MTTPQEPADEPEKDEREKLALRYETVADLTPTDEESGELRAGCGTSGCFCTKSGGGGGAGRS